MKFCVCNSLFHFFPSSSPRSEVVLDFDTSSFKSFPHAMAPRGGSAAHARDAAQSSRPPAEENKVRQRVRARGASSWNEEWRRRVHQKKKKKKSSSQRILLPCPPSPTTSPVSLSLPPLTRLILTIFSTILPTKNQVFSPPSAAPSTGLAAPSSDAATQFLTAAAAAAVSSSWASLVALPRKFVFSSTERLADTSAQYLGEGKGQFDGRLRRAGSALFFPKARSSTRSERASACMPSSSSPSLSLFLSLLLLAPLLPHLLLFLFLARLCFRHSTRSCSSSSALHSPCTEPALSRIAILSNK